MTQKQFVVLAVLVALGFATPLLAADQPEVIEARRKSSHEQVRIAIDRVTQQRGTHKEEGETFNVVHIEVTAFVTGVTRSQSGLKKGQKILIDWMVPAPGELGGGSWAVPPNVGVEYDAFLNKAHKKKLFEPAANHRSFDPKPPKVMP